MGIIFALNAISLKTFVFYIVFLFLLIPAIAQQQESSIGVQVGPELKMNNNILVPMIFGHNETGYYAYSFDYREGIVQYDTAFRFVRSKYLNLMNGFRKKTLLALFYFHDSLYMFTSDERTRNIQLFVETIDKETLEQNNDVRLLMDVRNMSGWTAEFKFKLSRQQNNLLIYSNLDVLSKKIQDLHFEMYGKGMNLEWEADQRIVYTGRRPRESIIEVNEKGDAFVISLLDDQGLRSLWQNIKNRYTLVAITENGQHANAYTLNLPGYYIRGVQIEPGGQYDLSVAGFYSPSFNRSLIDGIFYFDLDNTAGEFRNRQMHEFEPWFIKDAVSGGPKREHEELFDFRVRQLIRLKNGDVVLLAENEFEQDYDTYLNIMAASFGYGGIEKWKRVIPKRQGINRYEAFNYSSYSVHAPWYADKLYLIYNDHIRNGVWPPEGKMKSFHPNEKTNLKVVGIGPSGELSSHVVYSKSRRRMRTPLPMQYYDMLDHRVVIPALRSKRFNYLKLSFNEL